MLFNEAQCLRWSGRAQAGDREGERRSPRGQEAVVWGQEGLASPQTQVAAPGTGSGLLGDILMDPVPVGGDAGVDTGSVGLGTAIAPADHARLQPGAVDLANQGSSRVALRRRGVSSGSRGQGWWGLKGRPWAHLAGVLLLTSCAHHVITDNLDVVARVQANVVVCVTNAVFYNGDLHLLQRERRWETYCGVRGEHAASGGGH